MRKSDQNRRLDEPIASAPADLGRLSDPEERYQAASQLVEQLAEAMTVAGRHRAGAVVELRNEETLSAQLGRRLGCLRHVPPTSSAISPRTQAVPRPATRQAACQMAT